MNLKHHIFNVTIFLLIIIAAFGNTSISSAGEPDMHRLSNGIKVIFKRNSGNKILAVNCFIQTGSLYETRAEAGLTNFVQRMLLKGTTSRSQKKIAEEKRPKS